MDKIQDTMQDGEDTTVREWPEGVPEEYHEPCPKCKGPTTIQRKGPHIEQRCSHCGHLRFVRQTWMAFVMPFGKYRGLSLVEILKRDRGYIEWGAANMRQASLRERFAEAINAQRRADVFFGHLDTVRLKPEET